MTHEFVLAILASLLSSTGGWGALQWILSRREKHRQESADTKLAEHDRWLRDAGDAYDRLQEDCDKCFKRLDRMGNAFYGLLDDLEDQIVPMLLLPEHDPREVSGAVRVSIRKARNAARDPG